MIQENVVFIEDWVRDAQKVPPSQQPKAKKAPKPPAPPPSRNATPAHPQSSTPPPPPAPTAPLPSRAPPTSSAQPPPTSAPPSRTYTCCDSLREASFRSSLQRRRLAPATCFSTRYCPVLTHRPHRMHSSLSHHPPHYARPRPSREVACHSHRRYLVSVCSGNDSLSTRSQRSSRV
ncbi:hypothetical protein PENSPDRAFT_416380 [Peniophora sp. CONT]|nr:hypothetical protein PENSPDRAFT_416380 [Peniophora sp. CONT]